MGIASRDAMPSCVTLSEQACARRPTISRRRDEAPYTMHGAAAWRKDTKAKSRSHVAAPPGRAMTRGHRI